VTRRLLRLLLPLAAALASSSCTVVETAGQAISAVDPELGGSVVRTAQATGKAMEDITPAQEYFLGRAVGATLLQQYPPHPNENVQRYLNALGQTLARFSDRPETFGGYQFMVLNTDEVNAFAAPGGKIFISKGMIRLCQSETDLAAVLAHEIGHVQHQHGARAIQKSRLTSALAVIGTEAARQLTDAETAQMLNAFEGSIQDVTGTLVNSGYGRALEHEADQAALAILVRAGYDPRGLVNVLHGLDEMENSRVDAASGPGFLKTHPKPRGRIDRVRPTVAAQPGVNETPAQAARYRSFRSQL
jgi:predicted Zn-dependent protease